MPKILAFAGSNSTTSINYKLVKYSVSLIQDQDITLLNMVNYPFPMFSEDHEKEHGFSNSLVEFKEDIKNSDGILLSVNEHNSSPSAYFKNVLDWLSRVDKNFLEGIPVLLMSTSPGKRGGISSHGIVKDLLPRFGADIKAAFSLPSFYQNFDTEKGITDPELAEMHKSAIDAFLKSLA